MLSCVGQSALTPCPRVSRWFDKVSRVQSPLLVCVVHRAVGSSQVSGGRIGRSGRAVGSLQAVRSLMVSGLLAFVVCQAGRAVGRAVVRRAVGPRPMS